MNIARYLERMNYQDEPAADLQTLAALMEYHVRHIPFEDLDIQAGIPITLDIDSFYDKVVTKKRGGYCYELNGLFCEMLRRLGFRVDMLSARVANGREYSPEYDHMALLVHVDGGQWLVDVGFGDFSLVPLEVNDNITQTDGRNIYKLNKVNVDGKAYYSADRWNEGRDLYVPQYIFSLTAHQLEDFASRNHYQQTNPDSHFMKTLMCSLPTAHGRISMINNRMVFTENGQKQEEAIRDEVHRQKLLSRHFNIALQAAFKCAAE